MVRVLFRRPLPEPYWRTSPAHGSPVISSGLWLWPFRCRCPGGSGHTTRVLRLRIAIRRTHVGRSGRPGLSRSASLRTWCACRPTHPQQSSHRPAMSRRISSLRPVVAITSIRSVITAVRVRFVRDPTEAGDQWPPTVIALHRNLKTRRQPVVGTHACLILMRHLGNGRLMGSSLNRVGRFPVFWYPVAESTSIRGHGGGPGFVIDVRGCVKDGGAVAGDLNEVQ